MGRDRSQSPFPVPPAACRQSADGSDTLAYRPFVGTHAAVADLGELETEFGPAEPMRTGYQRVMTSGDTVFNLGIAEGWEAVLQGQAFTLLSPG